MGFGSVFSGPLVRSSYRAEEQQLAATGVAARRRAVIAAAPAALPPYHAQVAPLSAAQRAAMTPSVWRPGCPVALSDLRRVTHHLRRLRRARPPRRARRQPHGRRSRRACVRRALRGALRDPAHGADRGLPAAPTSARSRPTTPRPSTAAARPARRTGRSTPTAGRSTSTRSRTRTSRGGSTSHPASRPYVDRARVRGRPGVISEGGVVTRAFARIGWGWGGRWSGTRDYQHLSASGAETLTVNAFRSTCEQRPQTRFAAGCRARSRAGRAPCRGSTPRRRAPARPRAASARSRWRRARSRWRGRSRCRG